MRPASPPNPSLIFETLNAYQRTAILRASIELDLFTAIAEGASDIERAAARCSASPRGIRILCDCLVTLGFLHKENGAYRLTEESALFLDRRSPAYLGSVTAFLGSPDATEPFHRLARIVRIDGSRETGATLAPDHPAWALFARSMAPMMAAPARMLANLAAQTPPAPGRILDIACGHGLFGIEAAKMFPHATIVAVDWAPVLEVARENAARAGLDGRFHTISGSALEVDLEGGYDLILIANFLQLLGPAACESLLRRIHAALNPGGRALTFGFIPDEDRVGPPAQALFAATMLAMTPEGDAYPFSAYEAMFSRAGFARSELVTLASGQRAVVSHRSGPLE